MFFSEAILARRGPLAKVWLAAHMERKLSKTQTLQADIEESVGAIMGQEVEIMALRLSGQLLLGVVRIYSRKAKYLLDDCNEALLKIKMAFRPGVVDMTEDQLAVNKNAITLQAGNVDFDLLIQDINFDMDFGGPQFQTSGQHIARAADITLASANDFLDLNDPGLGFDLGPNDGIGSQDFDLGIDFGDAPEAGGINPEDETMSVEVGRDAAAFGSPRASIDSNVLGKNVQDDILSHRSREGSVNPFGDFDMGDDVGQIDLGLSFDMDNNLGDTLGETGPEEGQAGEGVRSPDRESSRLSTPPPVGEEQDGTPRVDGGDESTKKKKFLNKKQIIDSVTELEGGPGPSIGRNGMNGTSQADVSSIVTAQNFLPRSRSVMRLLEIRQDPLAHFMPVTTNTNGTFFCAAPPGLAPELSELFMRPITNILGNRRRDTEPDKANKKAKLDKENIEEDIEVGRRAGSLAPSGIAGSEFRGDFDQTNDFGGDMGPMVEDYQFDVDNVNVGAAELERARSKSRFSTPAADDLFDEEQETFADANCPIAVFDEKPTQTQSQQEAADQEGKGYSRTTVKALSVIRKELQPVAGQPEKVMSFQQMSQKSSRRAASSFFFELLVLGTRDCVKLSQAHAYENIEIRAKDRLWERQSHGLASQSQA